MTYWFCGQKHQSAHLEIAIVEPALLYGATVFTTLRVYNQTLDHPHTHWAAHVERLRHALATFHWVEPDWAAVRQGADYLKQEFPILRVTCFPDGRELITGRPLPTGLEQMQQQGIVAWAAAGEQYQRSHPGYKTGNYLGNFLALQAAQRQGAQEAILIDTQGRWLETSTGNLWGWAEGHWWTPPLQDGLLPGVARLHLLHHLQSQGQSVRQDHWTQRQIQRFEALAYSNSGIQVVPIHTVLTDQSRLGFDPQHWSLTALRTAFLGS
jgi:4-amino-4-deoxychorismate lyase